MKSTEFLLGCLLAAPLLAGCTAPAPSPAPEPDLPPLVGEPVVFLPGRVAMGPVQGAQLRAYELEEGGARGRLIGAGTTNATGAFQLGFVSLGNHSVLVESYGGTANGKRLSHNVPLTAVFEAGLTQRVSITTLTHMAASRALVLAREGIPTSLAVVSSNAGLNSQYLLPDVIETDPGATLDDPRRYATLHERAYRGIVGGLEVLAETLGTTPFILAQALGRDASDGILDGRFAGGAVRLQETQTAASGAAQAGFLSYQQAPPAQTLARTAGTQMLLNAIETYAGRVGPGQPAFPIAIDPIPIGAGNVASLYGGTSVLPAFRVGETASVTLSALGGSGTYGCLTMSALPEGFTRSGCTLTGNPPPLPSGTTKRITPPFVIRIVDVTSPAFQDLYLSATILPQKLQITTIPVTCAADADGLAKGDQCSGGGLLATAAPPLTFGSYQFRADSLRYGSPPFGMWIGLDGFLKGDTERDGTHTFRVCAVDFDGVSDCGDVTVTINGAGPLAGPFQGSFGRHSNGLGCEWDVDYNGRLEVALAAQGGIATLTLTATWTIARTNPNGPQCTGFAEETEAVAQLQRTEDGYRGNLESNDGFNLVVDLTVRNVAGTMTGSGDMDLSLWTRNDRSDIRWHQVALNVALT